MTREEEAKLREETKERSDRVARQLRDDLHAVLSKPEGQRIWVWIRYELCSFDDVPPDQFPGRRAVALALEQALLMQPELVTGVIDARADLEKSQAFYHAGLARLKTTQQKER